MDTYQRKNSYLIVGAGCMGASTALHLKQLLPLSSVTLVDRARFPNPAAAAHDLNKVVRTDYDELFYMKLALEAMDMWKTDPLFSLHYHETGVMWADSDEMSKTVMENYRSLGIEPAAEILDPEKARARWGGIFRDTEFPGLKQALYNPIGGWADAEPALRGVIQKAVDLGGRYVADGVRKVLFSDGGMCIGVQTITGTTLLADRVTLCTGAHTAQILADSAPDRPEMQVGDRMTAAAATMTLFRVPEDQMHKYSSAPVIINTLAQVQGTLSHRCQTRGIILSRRTGESIPPGSRGLCKCTYEESFTNKIVHKGSGQVISVPPEPSSQNTWSQDVPSGLKAETAKVSQLLYGQWIENLEPVQHRMCWLVYF